MDAVALPDTTIDPSSDLGRQLVVDLARFREGLVDETAIRKKFKLDNEVWRALAGNDELIRAVEAEAVRRIADGSVKREKAQLLVVKAPDVAASIMLNDSANDRHRLDACKVLNDFSANGPAGAPASDRFIITINLGDDHVLHFDKSIAIDPHDTDRFNDVDTDVTATPWGIFPTKKKDGDDGGQGHI